MQLNQVNANLPYWGHVSLPHVSLPVVPPGISSNGEINGLGRAAAFTYPPEIKQQPWCQLTPVPFPVLSSLKHVFLMALFSRGGRALLCQPRGAISPWPAWSTLKVISTNQDSLHRDQICEWTAHCMNTQLAGRRNGPCGTSSELNWIANMALRQWEGEKNNGQKINTPVMTPLCRRTQYWSSSLLFV